MILSRNIGDKKALHRDTMITRQGLSYSAILRISFRLECFGFSELLRRTMKFRLLLAGSLRSSGQAQAAIRKS
ncbi:MAG: hypothetical protein KKE17_08455 [Proteobacteria bacterium]|nr:hypothetical protein [Pseudomonadota bacterium]